MACFSPQAKSLSQGSGAGGRENDMLLSEGQPALGTEHEVERGQ